MTDTDDRWLSLNEICDYLGVSNDTVYKWIDKHGLPAYRIGRLWKFKRKDVDEWVKAGGTAKQGTREK
ncbi:MAG: helix-turn-helix domain-containing protein [Chloroflexi bacterium]|nr:helix-turn-helix domain-containing protein [Chloroflexota bacterium]